MEGGKIQTAMDVEVMEQESSAVWEMQGGRKKIGVVYELNARNAECIHGQ